MATAKKLKVTLIKSRHGRLKSHRACVAGLGLRSDEKLFAGWFGPRGLASIVFAVIVLNEHLPGGDTISVTAVSVIILSILGHGLSANPLVRVLAHRIGSRGPDKTPG